MGTYLRFSVTGDKRKQADAWLREKSKGLGLWSEKDRKIELAKEGGGYPDYMQLGEGQIKISGGDEERDKEVKRMVDILIEARTKWGLECQDVPSNVGDYINKTRLQKLIDLPAYEKIWQAEREDDLLWDKAKRKAMAAAAKDVPGGHTMTVETWGLDRANLLFVRCNATDHPAWVGVSYDQRGAHTVTTHRQEGERFDLLCDAKGRGFLGIPLMALGTKKNGFDEIRDYLVRAFDIGLRTHPDAIMIGVYHALPEKIDFGDELTQVVHGGPFVRGTYDVASGASYSQYNHAVRLDSEGKFEWETLRGNRAVMLKRRFHGKRFKDSGGADRFYVTYQALAIMATQAEENKIHTSPSKK